MMTIEGKKLTERQEKFCVLMATGNYSQYGAAKGAGYTDGASSNASTKLMRDPRLVARIAQHQRVKNDSDTIDQAWVVREAVSTYRKAKGSNQNAVAVSALNLLAKHTGGFDGGEHAQTTNYNLVLAGLTPDEIREIAKRQLPSESPVKVDTPIEVDVDDGYGDS
jgi:phage terminase small subunit